MSQEREREVYFVEGGRFRWQMTSDRGSFDGAVREQ